MRNLSLLDVICCAIFCNIVIFKLVASSQSAEDSGRRFVCFCAVHNPFSDKEIEDVKIAVRISRDGQMIDERLVSVNNGSSATELFSGEGKLRVSPPIGSRSPGSFAMHFAFMLDGILPENSEVDVAVSQHSPTVSQTAKNLDIWQGTIELKVSTNDNGLRPIRGKMSQTDSTRANVLRLTRANENGLELLRQKMAGSGNPKAIDGWRQSVVNEAFGLSTSVIPSKSESISHEQMVNELKAVAHACEDRWYEPGGGLGRWGVNECQELLLLAVLSARMESAVVPTTSSIADQSINVNPRVKAAASDLSQNVDAYLDAYLMAVGMKKQTAENPTWILLKSGLQEREAIRASDLKDKLSSVNSLQHAGLTQGRLFFAWCDLVTKSLRMDVTTHYGDRQISTLNVRCKKFFPGKVPTETNDELIGSVLNDSKGRMRFSAKIILEPNPAPVSAVENSK